MKNPVHPGEILREDVIVELDLTVGEVAEALGISRVALSRVLHEHTRVTPNVALRLEAAGIVFIGPPTGAIAAMGAQVREITLWSGIKSLRLHLWDETTNQLISFRQARAAMA